MSRKYKFLNPEGLYFLSFATVNWIDVFVNPIYCDIIVESLTYCKNSKGLELFYWCIMPTHIHLIIRAKQNNPQQVLGMFKEYTSKQIIKEIANNTQELRKESLLQMFNKAGSKSSNVNHYQFWQHDNRPIELWSKEVIQQKVEYLHNNPVKANLVAEQWEWKYSSAIDYFGGKGLIELDYL